MFTPPPTARRPALLVVDSDTRFRPNSDVLVARSRQEAQQLLASGRQAFSGIFVNPAVSRFTGISVIRFVLQQHPGTPTFFIYDGNTPPISPEEMKKVAIHDALPKPISYERMAEIVAPILSTFNPDIALRIARSNTDIVGAEIAAHDVRFIPVRVSTLLSGKQSFFDLYIRIGVGKYLKLLKAGDSLQPERLLAYLSKGITHFYLRREAQLAYLAYCDHLSSELAVHRNAPAQLKTEATANFGEETIRFLREHGVSSSRLRFAAHFVNHAQKLIKQLKLGRDPILERYLADLNAYDHAVATAFVVSLMLGPMRIESERIQQLIGLASLLHDVGLYQLAPRLKSEHPAAMTIGERHAYLEHPQEGARMLHDIHGVDAVVVQAIAQHHERRDGHGFPRGLAAGRISRVAEMIGIADEFVQLLEVARKDPTRHPLTEMQNRVFDQFSSDIVDAFCLAFLRQNRRD